MKKKFVDIPGHVDDSLVFDLDIYSDKSLKLDMHNRLGKLHENYPDIFYSPYRGGYWVVTRKKDIDYVLSHADEFSSSIGMIPPPEKEMPLLPLSLDPPANQPYRARIMRFLGPKHVRALEKVVREKAIELIDGVRPAQSCEFLREVGAPLPVMVFMKMMGLPLERFDYFRSIVVEFFSSDLTENRREKLYLTMLDELSMVIRDREKYPKQDMISSLVHDEIEGRKLSISELQSMALLLFVAGMDTVANAATFMFYYLSKAPQIQKDLLNNMALIPQFIEESLRMYSVINTPRVVAKDTILNGVKMNRGDMVLVMLSIAGRDSREIELPSEFMLDRSDRLHVSFGGGAHICAGQHLARMELRVLLEEWLSKVGRFNLGDPDVTFRSFQVMAMSELRLQW